MIDNVSSTGKTAAETSARAQPKKENKNRKGIAGLPSISHSAGGEQCRTRVKSKKFKGGSSRGIETMLRSQYRTHLDLTSLADNKASIMITINGLIISILLATGGSVVAFADNNLYILPIIVLLISGFISMIYAVISARPIAERCCDAVKGPEDFLNGKANVMYFMDNADLTNDEYVAVMKEVMDDKNLVYEEMVSYIHTMSVIIRRKFFLLRTSYSVFIVGLGLCIVTFIGVAGVIMLKPEQPDMVGQSAEPARFSRFPFSSGIYEPSGVHQLSDGRVLVVEDEPGHPFALLTFGSPGEVSSVRLSPGDMFEKNGPYRQFRNLDDLEGVDVDSKGYVYIITSHSDTESGNYDDDRGKLARFRVSGSRIVEPFVVTGLRKELIKIFPELERGAADGQFNVEALSLNARQDKLLLGFRAPLDGQGRALIAVINDLDALFADIPSFYFQPELIRLDLNGNAIRGMSYDSRLRGYLIVAGSSKKGGGKQNQLWFWKGEPEIPPRLVAVKGLSGVKNAEGVSSIRIGADSRILIVSDDGDRKNSKKAGFLLIDYQQIQLR